MSKKRRFSKPVKKQTLAEQVTEAIKEAILAGDWSAGEALPTEPELAEQFEVSRAVVRDATRMLAAQGLVEAQHGRGVFVTASQVEAFGEALLLALRRANATVWDVEHFEQILFPEVCALATAEATDAEIETIREQIAENLKVFNAVTTKYWDQEGVLPAMERERILQSYRQVMQAVFDATHNRVLQLLAQPLLSLRNLRTWHGKDESLEKTLEREAAYLHALVDAIASRDPEQARRTVAQLMQLPAAAEAAMRQTPVGEMPVIPL